MSIVKFGLALAAVLTLGKRPSSGGRPAPPKIGGGPTPPPGTTTKTVDQGPFSTALQQRQATIVRGGATVSARTSSSSGTQTIPTAGSGAYLPYVNTISGGTQGAGLIQAAQSEYAELQKIRSAIGQVTGIASKVADILKSVGDIGAVLSSITAALGAMSWFIAMAVEGVTDAIGQIVSQNSLPLRIRMGANFVDHDRAGIAGLTWGVDKFLGDAVACEQALYDGRSDLGLYDSKWPQTVGGRLAARVFAIYYAFERNRIYTATFNRAPNEPAAPINPWTFDLPCAGSILGISGGQIGVYRTGFGNLDPLESCNAMAGGQILLPGKILQAAANLVASGAAGDRTIWGLSTAAGRDGIGSAVATLCSHPAGQRTWDDWLDYPVLRAANRLSFTDDEWGSLVMSQPRESIPGIDTYQQLDTMATDVFGSVDANKLRGYGRALARGIFVANCSRQLTHWTMFISTPTPEETVAYVKRWCENVVPVSIPASPAGMLDFDGGRVNVVESSKTCRNVMALLR